MKQIEKLRSNRRILNHLDIIKEKIQKKVFDIGLLEFHPSDRCPLECMYCTYSNSKSAIFPFNGLEKLSIFNPRAIVISGGGEPLYYNYKGKNFIDLINKIRCIFPKAQMGLISNGQFIEKGDWVNTFDWVRISVDTSKDSTFKMIKDGNLQKSLDTIGFLLNQNVKHVGIGYVYSRLNINEVYDFLKLIYKTFYLNVSDEIRKKINIQFRPTCMVSSCNCPSESYREIRQLMTPDDKPWWKNFVETQKILIFNDTDKDFVEFVKTCSNLSETDLFCFQNSLPSFKKCYNSLIRAIVRANGDVFPCVMRACNNAKPIANVLNITNVDEIYYNQMLYYNLSNNYCEGPNQCCRVDGHKNQLVDSYLDKNSLETLPSEYELNSSINYFF